MSQYRSAYLKPMPSLSSSDLSGNGLLHGAGVISACLYVAMGELNRSASGIDLWWFLLLMLMSVMIVAGLYWRFTEPGVNLRRHSTSRPVMSPDIGVIVFWAVVLRVIGICYAPIMEDDYYRYLWDAYVFAQQGTPYGLAPSEFFGDKTVPETFQRLLDGINYPDTPTIYGPLLQYSFLLSHALFPGQVLGLQLIYSVADVLLILVLAKMSTRPALLLYAWSPLLIKETAFTAHPDVLGVLLLMGSILALQRQRFSAAAVLLGFSLCAKVFAILLAPLILWRCGPRHWLLFAITVAAVYAPFLWASSSDAAGLFAFANDWQFNGSVHALLAYWNGYWGYAEWLPKALIASLFCGFYAVYGWHYLSRGARRGDYGVPRGDWIFGVFFLLAPVVNAWYLVWLLAFASIYPSRWAWVASVAVLLSYVTGGALDTATLDLYQQPLWARLLEYGAIAVAVVLDLRDRQRRVTTAESNHSGKDNAAGAPVAVADFVKTART